MFNLHKRCDLLIEELRKEVVDLKETISWLKDKNSDLSDEIDLLESRLRIPSNPTPTDSLDTNSVSYEPIPGFTPRSVRKKKLEAKSLRSSKIKVV